MHPIHVDGLTPKELAKAVGNLRYDALRDFVEALSVELQEQSHNDVLKDRRKLAGELDQAGHRLAMACFSIDDAWLICKPFMNESEPPAISDDEAEGMLKRLTAHGHLK